MSEFRILIVEDEPVIAENIALYLNTKDFTVSGIAYDLKEARQQLAENTPDAVLIDINLGTEADGIDLACHINKHHHLPFIFLTSYADKHTLDRAKEVEPDGYIVKPFNETTLIATLQIAISNFARRHRLLVPFLSYKKINKYLITQLSEREFEVIQQIFEGKTNQQIADNIVVSVNTVKKHINSAYLKLDVNTRTRAIARLIELMLL